MKNKVLAVLTMGILTLTGLSTAAMAQSSASDTATKPDKKQTESGRASDSTTRSPVDPSKSDKPGEATAPKGSSGTDNAKTGVEPSKPGAADQTQAK